MGAHKPPPDIVNRLRHEHVHATVGVSQASNTTRQPIPPLEHTMSTPTTRSHVIVVCLAAAMVLTACASADVATESAATQEPSESVGSETASAEPDMTREEPDPGGTAVSFPATGTLGVDDIEGGCVYVEIDGTRYELLAGTGADIAVDPANGVVAAADGTVIARTGEMITVDGAVDPGIVTFCQMGPVLVATDVTAG